MICITNSANQYSALKRVPEQQFLELVSCTKHSFFENYSWKIVPSDKHTLIYMLSGSMRVKEINKSIVKNDALLVRDFSRLSMEIEGNTEFAKIDFFASPIVPVLTCWCEGTALVTSGKYPQISKLYKMSNNKKTLLGVKEAVLLDLLNDINEHMNATSSELSLYKRACEWVEIHSDSAISAQDVADSLNCSRAHLNRVIKLIDGECLSDKIIRYRLERIKSMCHIEDITVTEIANRLGFYSAELLCKFFKYHTGRSISEYRKSEERIGDS